MESVSPSSITVLAVGLGFLVVFSTLALQVVFSKFYERGWRAWVPFLNGWTFFNLAGMSGAFIFTLLVPVLGTVVALMAVAKISRLLGFDSVGMTWLAFFFPTLWLLVMAISRNKSDSELAAIEQRKIARNAPKPTPMTQGREWVLGTNVPAPVATNPLVQKGYQQQEEMSFGYGKSAPTQPLR